MIQTNPFFCSLSYRTPFSKNLPVESIFCGITTGAVYPVVWIALGVIPGVVAAKAYNLFCILRVFFSVFCNCGVFHSSIAHAEYLIRYTWYSIMNMSIVNYHFSEEIKHEEKI